MKNANNQKFINEIHQLMKDLDIRRSYQRIVEHENWNKDTEAFWFAAGRRLELQRMLEALKEIDKVRFNHDKTNIYL